MTAKKTPTPTDAELVGLARDGDRDALENLVRRYQRWIYNVALRMVWSPEDARDVTQEVLIKVVTKLATFRGRSSFRTWLYRITANHVLNMKRRGSEITTVSFDEYAERINRCPDDALPDPATVPVAPEILVEESKLACMTGMLMCLDREQRLTFILGAILQLGDRTGAAVLEVSRGNYRQKLSRARRDLRNFLNNQCGLVNHDNPCRCAKKTRAYITLGVVNPDSLRFNRAHQRTVREEVGRKSRLLEDWLRFFVDQPFDDGPDFVTTVRSALKSRQLRRATGIDPGQVH